MGNCSVCCGVSWVRVWEVTLILGGTTKQQQRSHGLAQRIGLEVVSQAKQG